jgi:hypothetical protein
VSYQGEMLDNQFHGQGRLCYLDLGVIFEGSFSYGKRNGLGTVYYPSANPSELNNGSFDNNGNGQNQEEISYTKLEANFENDVIIGVPSISYADGDIYIGAIINRQMEGNGSYYYKQSNDLYLGSFSNGLRSGVGLIKFGIRGQPHMIDNNITQLLNLNKYSQPPPIPPKHFEFYTNGGMGGIGGSGGGTNIELNNGFGDGKWYEQWLERLKNNEKIHNNNNLPQFPTLTTITTQYLTDCNELYYGEFLYDKFDGNGIYLSNNGIYIGFFKNGLKHGHGTLIYPNGNIYYGEFDSGLKSGYGVLRYSRGGSYYGYWGNDVAEGSGECIYANKEVFFGNFHLGRKNGNGILTLQTGDIVKAVWNNDTINGEGIIIYQNGIIYEGMLSNDSREGLGKLIDKVSNTIFQGHFVQNKRHGEGKIIFSDGSCVIATWKYGRVVGEMVYHMANHSIWNNPDL